MAVNVIGVNGGNSINIAGNDHAIDSATELRELATALGVGEDFLFTLLRDASFGEGENIPLTELIGRVVQEGTVLNSSGDVEKMLEKVRQLQEQIGRLDPNAEQNAAKKISLQQLKSSLEGELRQARDAVQRSFDANGQNSSIWTDPLKQQAQALRFNTRSTEHTQDRGTTDTPAAPSGTDWRAQTLNPQGSGQTGNQQGGNGGWRQTGAGSTPAGGSPYGLFGGGGAVGGANNSLAFGLLNALDDFRLSSMDDVNRAQSQQRQMMLFMYYAQRAMSGDINAMYQFVRFIGYVIARDKALQNVWLGTKLVELQEESRAATQELLDANPGDSLSEQTEFNQLMTRVRAQENSIATDQKLIAQMMEEFTQVVEVLTNIQKSLLDAAGKISSNISVWR